MLRITTTALLCSIILSIGCMESKENVKVGALDLARSITVSPNETGSFYKVYWPDKSLMAEGPVANKKKNGLWKMYFKGTGGTVVLAEVPFKDDMPDGEMKEYYRSGKLLCKTNFKNGIMNGSRMSYYESGIGKIEEFYKDGKKNGKSFEYYDNGNTRENSYYRDDVRHGASMTFHPNGKREASGRYSAGKKNGP